MKKLLSVLSLSFLFIACSDKNEREAQIMRAKQMTIDSINAEQAKQRTIDSMKAVTAEREARAERRAVENISGTTSSTTENSSSTTKKKGLNATATGALIGAGAGAITGAMVDGKKEKVQLWGLNWCRRRCRNRCHHRW